MILFLLLFLLSALPAHAQYAPSLGPQSPTPEPPSPIPTISQAPTSTPHLSPVPTTEQSPTPTVTLTPTPTTNPAFDLFEQQLNEYLALRDTYATQHALYQAAKKVDSKYSTLDTRQKKLDAGKLTIFAREKMLKSYLALIRINLDKYKNTNFDQTDKYQKDLEAIEKWLGDQILVVQKIDEPQELQKWAESYRKEYLSIQTTMYTGMTLAEINQNIYVLNQIKTILVPFQNSESQIYVDEVNRQASIAQDNLNSAYNMTQKKQSTERFIPFYPEADSKIHSSKTTISTMINNLKFIVSRFGN